MAEIEIQAGVTILATVLTFIAGFLLSILIERKKKKYTNIATVRSFIAELAEVRTSISNHVRTDETLAAMSRVRKRNN